MDIQEMERNLREQLAKVETDVTNTELEELLEQEGLVQPKAEFIRIESTQSTEEPTSLNTRIVNLGKSKTVTLLACKTIYNAYRESDLNTLIRVGIIPNYPDLLDDTLELLELLNLFVSRLEHKADIAYINTPAMTVKAYKELSYQTRDGKEKCEVILKNLKLNANYALYVLHYNLLSGSTIIQEPSKYKEEAKRAVEILKTYCNKTSKEVDVKVILSKYQTLKNTYEEVLRVKKEAIAADLTKTFNKSSKIMLSIAKLEEDYTKQSNKLSTIGSILEKMDELQQRTLLSKVNQLYEQQLIQHAASRDNMESTIVDTSIRTLALFEKNYSQMQTNLNNLNTILDRLTTMDKSKSVEAVSLKVKHLLELYSGLIGEINQLNKLLEDNLN